MRVMHCARVFGFLWFVDCGLSFGATTEYVLQKIRVQDTLSIDGYVQKKGAISLVAPEVSEVDQIHAKQGQKVKAGEVILTLKSPTLLKALKAKQDEYQLAGLGLKKLEQAIKEKKQVAEVNLQFSDDKKIDRQSLSEIEDASINFKKEQLRVNSLQDEIQTIQKNIDSLQIKATKDCEVDYIIGALGVVDKGSFLVRLVDPDATEITGQIPSSDGSLVVKGLDVSFSSNGGTVAGKVGKTVVDTQQNTMQIFINYADKSLSPGSMVTADLILKDYGELLALPKGYVKTNGTANFVYQLTADKKVVTTPVTIGQVSNEWVEITSGVSSGSHLVPYWQVD